MVGYGDTMSVAAQVAQGMFRASEGAFRVDYPIVTKQLTEPRGERFGVSEECEIPVKAEFAISEGAPESGDELAAKDPTEDLDWKKEVVTRLDPAGVIQGQAASRNHTMDMRMMFQFLVPGVKHAEEADFRAEMLGVTGDFQERFRTGSEQEAVNQLFVL